MAGIFRVNLKTKKLEPYSTGELSLLEERQKRNRWKLLLWHLNRYFWLAIVGMGLFCYYAIIVAIVIGICWVAFHFINKYW